MKRIAILILSLLLICGMLGGCTDSNKPDEETASATAPTVATQDATGIPSTFPTPTLPIEPIPENTDDSDYQLPPGERPTVVPEIK